MMIIMEAMPQLRNITSRAQRQVACNVQNRLIFTSKSPYISNNTRRQVQHHRDTGCGVTRRPLVSSIRQRNNHVRNRTRVPSMLSRNFGGERAWRAQPAVMNICTGNRTGVAENDPRHWVAAMAAAGVAAAAVIHQADNGHASSHSGRSAAYGRTIPLPRYAVADAVEAASPWVVNVIAGMPGARGLLEPDEDGVPRSSGSGFVISSEGLVVTNAHVVERFVDGMVIITLNTGERFPGKVQAIDRRSDLALLKCEVPSDRLPLPVAEIGQSLHLRAGEFVVAMGSPGGLANTCTLGIVSATARARSDLVEDARTATLIGDSTEFIQTDAAINSGNSGGPLIDLDGKVVALQQHPSVATAVTPFAKHPPAHVMAYGINTLKLHGAEGLGFAIPIDTAWQIVTELIRQGRVDRPQLGMRLVAADPGQATGRGVMILSVTPGGAAEAAGLRFGDLITEFDGKPVTTTTDVLQRIGREVGRSIDVTIRRDGQAKTRRVTVVTESDVATKKST